MAELRTITGSQYVIYYTLGPLPKDGDEHCCNGNGAERSIKMNQPSPDLEQAVILARTEVISDSASIISAKEVSTGKVWDYLDPEAVYFKNPNQPT
jgi:hypothetical protein